MNNTSLIEIHESFDIGGQKFCSGDTLLLTIYSTPQLAEYIYIGGHVEQFIDQNSDEIIGVIRAIYRDCDVIELCEIPQWESNVIH